MLRTILLVGIGGFLGSIGRYLLSVWITEKSTMDFPLGTMIVNITGCLIIGFAFGWFLKNFSWEEWQPLVITGLLGGFTTFSSFSLEAVMLLRSGAVAKAGIYVFGSLLIGILATMLGFWLSQFLPSEA